MSNLSKLQNLLEAQGRVLSEFDRVFEGVRETIVEHLWKLYAYHDFSPKDVNGWLKSLNKHLVRLRRFNKPKGVKSSFNRGYLWLKDKFVGEDFEDLRDLEILAGSWISQGYPSILVTEKDVEKIHKLADKYIKLILSKSGDLSVSIEELK